MSLPPTDRVAIVMITHNRCEETLRSLEHLAQLPEQPTIVLVDNGSTDGTLVAVARRFPQIQSVDAGRNLGAAGRNLGVRRVNAPYVALCDDDTWWKPGSLAHAANLFDQHPRLGVLTARILVGSQDREDPVCGEMERSPLPNEPGLPGRPLLGFLAGASVVRRSAFLEAGGFSDTAFIGGEEELLAVDLAARGWRLRYVPDLVVHHHPSARRDAFTRRAHLTRNALWFSWQRRPLKSAIRRTFQLARQLPWDSAVRRGFLSALAGFHMVYRQRRVVPPEVERGLRLLESHV